MEDKKGKKDRGMPGTIGFVGQHIAEITLLLVLAIAFGLYVHFMLEPMEVNTVPKKTITDASKQEQEET